MNIPDGTRDVLPAEWAWRAALRRTLQAELSAWGYQGVEVPALELQDPHHPLDNRAFKLIDRGGEVLALRSEFTTAVLRLVRARFAGLPYPIRLQYAGPLWLRRLTGDVEPGRLREYTQVGAELVGVSDARADAELVTVARSALEAAGLRAQFEVGHPGFVDAVLEDAGVLGEAREALHVAIDRKSPADLRANLGALGAAPEVARTLEALIELYGPGDEVLAQAARLPLGPLARAQFARLAAVVERIGDGTIGVDLGMSRRYTYYSGFTFRAYAPGVNLPILGGGRYDAGLPGAGFALGLERLTQALGGVPPQPGETVLALDVTSARWAQTQGLNAELAWTDDPLALAQYARTRGITRLARGERFETLEVQA